MPAEYAHYRFGRLAFSALPEEPRRTVQRFRQLFDVGLHGPDLFFYYQPLWRTKMGELGSRFHALSGQEFFSRAAEQLRENPSEGGEAYLYGVLCHYALDSMCHPFVREAVEEGRAGHLELETEFDRYLMTLDGAESPHTQNRARHVHLTWGESVTVASFYPPAGAFAVRRSAGSMAAVNRILAIKNRKLLESVFRLGGSSAAQMVMYSRANHKCAQMMEPLMTLFGEALARYPGMAAQLNGLIRSQASLDEAFDKTFG